MMVILDNANAAPRISCIASPTPHISSASSEREVLVCILASCSDSPLLTGGLYATSHNAILELCAVKIVAWFSACYTYKCVYVAHSQSI